MNYEGIVTGNFVKLPEGVNLPEGTKVEIIVKRSPKFKKGSPKAILQAIESLPSLSEEASEELDKAIKEGRCSVNWANPFDKGE